MLTIDQLKLIMPRLAKLPSRLQAYYQPLCDAMEEAAINTRERMAAFLAQIAHESAELRYMEEVADGSHYEGRRDLGNVQPGDGKRFKGRGPIQLTGRLNYRRCGKALGVDLEGQPELAAHPEYAFRTACWFWTTHHLNELADAGEFDQITHRINGGYNGKASRDAYYAKALSVLT